MVEIPKEESRCSGRIEWPMTLNRHLINATDENEQNAGAKDEHM